MTEAMSPGNRLENRHEVPSSGAPALGRGLYQMPPCGCHPSRTVGGRGEGSLLSSVSGHPTGHLRLGFLSVARPSHSLFTILSLSLPPPPPEGQPPSQSLLLKVEVWWPCAKAGPSVNATGPQRVRGSCPVSQEPSSAPETAHRGGLSLPRLPAGGEGHRQGGAHRVTRRQCCCGGCPPTPTPQPPGRVRDKLI